MSKRDKDVNPHKQESESAAQGDAKKHFIRSTVRPPAWGTLQKLASEGKKMQARRKLPSGPLGGTGRKTNVSRST